MRKLVFTLILSFSYFLIDGANAQIKFGYLSYDMVMHQMPEYTQAQEQLADLRKKYEQEATRGEEEFQHKFSDFLQGQKDFPENILLKRQAELQTLMEAGIKFRQDAQQLIEKAEKEMLSSINDRLNEAIRTVGLEAGYAAILNTDNNHCPFINPAMGDDITILVLRQLGVEQEVIVSEEKNEEVPATE